MSISPGEYNFQRTTQPEMSQTCYNLLKQLAAIIIFMYLSVITPRADNTKRHKNHDCKWQNTFILAYRQQPLK